MSVNWFWGQAKNVITFSDYKLILVASKDNVKHIQPPRQMNQDCCYLVELETKLTEV